MKVVQHSPLTKSHFILCLGYNANDITITDLSHYAIMYRYIFTALPLHKFIAQDHILCAICYHSQTEKPEDIFITFNFRDILTAPECPDQVEYLMVLDSEEEDENPGSKAYEERQVTDQNTPDQKTWNKLNITDHSDKWKLSALAYNCQDSDPESTALNIPQHSNHFSTCSVPQHKPDIYQNGSGLISHKNIARSAQTSYTCSVEQNEINVTPGGLMEYVERKQMANCKQKLTIEEEEDYSKVSGIYRETVLVIQKDSSPVQRHKKRNNDGPSKKIKNEITSSDKNSIDTQEYLATFEEMF